MARRQDVGALNETVYLNPILVSPSNTMGLTGDEALSFDFFRKRTAMEIQGCFQSSLWESLVLQIGSQEPAVMHAATAVGYAHRKHIEKDLARQAMIDEDPRVYLGLRQYVKAINCLRTRIVDLEDPEASQIALMTCLLFICFEMLRGQRISALSHLGTGLRILSSRAAQQRQVTPDSLDLNHDSEGVLDQLISVFARLDYEFTMFGHRYPLFRLLPQQNSTPKLALPSEFASVAEARQYMDILASSTLRFRGKLLDIASRAVPDHVSPDLLTRLTWEYAITRNIDLSTHSSLLAELRDIQDSLAVWPAAFEAYRRQLDEPQRENESRALILLETQHFYSYFLIAGFRR